MPHNVSVVIPAKNEETTITRCLQQLTAQMDAGDEIVVLDNGSTDDTASVASDFEGVRVIDAPDSRFDDVHYRGLAQLRQLGAHEARNEIVATTDADTVPPDDWLDRIKTHFDADPDLNVVWGIVTDTNGVPVRSLSGKYLPLLGGVSGANTAFRKAAFEDLEMGYTGWPVFEDVALVTRMVRTGKSRHDRGMEMQSDLDRRRYQTIPMLVTGGAGLVGGAVVGGRPGAALAGAGGSLAATELFYEAAPTTEGIHHDQAGLVAILVGTTVGGVPGMAAAGVGAGLLGHHVLTEGASALPTNLMQNTDIVCSRPEDAPADIQCVPSGNLDTKLTRVLAAATIGAVGARTADWLRKRRPS